MLLESRFDEDGNLSDFVPVVVEHYKYYDTVLLISAIELHAPNTFTNRKIVSMRSTRNIQRFFFVPSLDGEAYSRKDLPEELSFETQKLAVGFSIVTTSDSAIYPAFFHEGSEAKIVYEHNKGNASICQLM